MTNTIYNFQILDFITDLDENITNTVVFDDGDDGEMTTFDFINPITGSLDTVSFFEDFDSHPIIYVPNFSEGRGYGKDQLEIADLDELYEFILIDEEE
jgi:hypothetical protein